MSDEAKPEPGKDRDDNLVVAQQSPASTESVQGELWPASALVTLERERVASRDRRTEVTRQAIEAENAADQRQYDYHVEKLRRDDEDRKRRHESGIRLLWALFTVTVGLTGFVFWMIFFGDDAQRSAAIDILRTIGTGLGGFGVVWFLLTAVRRFLAR